jgi:guanosine-3',5'-bis(diphosphate) 3'-pyrophosphohydrolase
MTPREFAIQAHGSQRYGNEPYSVHLDAVAALAGPDHEAVAYLHDVLEDTTVAAAEVERHFGPHVRACVELLTDPAGANRRERKRLLHARLRAVGPEHHAALVVKAADRLANVRASASDSPDLLAMYRGEHEEFRAAVYRPGLCEHLWQELEQLLAV